MTRQLFTRQFTAPINTNSIIMSGFQQIDDRMIVFSHYTMSRHIFVQYEAEGDKLFNIHARMTAHKAANSTDRSVCFLVPDEAIDDLLFNYRPRRESDDPKFTTTFLMETMSEEAASDYSLRDLLDFKAAILKVIANLPKRYSAQRDVTLPKIIHKLSLFERLRAKPSIEDNYQ